MIKPPDSAEIFETSNSKYWFEGELLILISKPGPRPDAETQRKELEDFRNRIDGKKVFAIMDVANTTPSSKEQREKNSELLPQLFKGIAFIITNPLTRMLAQLYLGTQSIPFPTKMCSSEREAREWIKSKA